MVKPTENLTDTCTQVDQGVLFTTLEYQCADETLQFDPGNTFDGKPPLVSDKAAVISYLNANKLVVCDPTNFMVAGSPLTITVRRSAKCPWYADEEITFNILVQYQEAITPFDFFNAPDVMDTGTWEALTTFTQEETSGSTGDHYGYGSTGEGKALLVIDVDPSVDPCDEDSTINFTCTLESLGLGTYEEQDSIPQPKVQVISRPCSEWMAGTGPPVDFFWVGTKFTPAHPVIGLIQSLFVTVTKG